MWGALLRLNRTVGAAAISDPPFVAQFSRTGSGALPLVTNASVRACLPRDNLPFSKHFMNHKSLFNNHLRETQNQRGGMKARTRELPSVPSAFTALKQIGTKRRGNQWKFCQIAGRKKIYWLEGCIC
jgi:hypothetical protein